MRVYVDLLERGRSMARLDAVREDIELRGIRYPSRLLEACIVRWRRYWV